jgi:hypothetical protein
MLATSWLAAVLLASAAPAGDVHRIDFRSFTYQPACADFESDVPKVPVIVTGGRFEAKPGTELEGIFFEVLEVLYGDLTGDGRDEAVVRTLCNTGGTGQFDEGFVYGMKSGKAVLLGRIPGGDRASGGVRCVRFEDGALKVERIGNDSGAARGVDFVDTETWRLKDGGLGEAGKAVRRRLGTGEGARPIRFAKGKSSGSVEGKTGGVDTWGLGARGGQTMTVRISSPQKNAAFEIMIDDDTVTCRTTGWTGELPGTGEYRVYVLATHGTASYKLDVSIR